jgi:putative heme-binding domain-containing protein
MWLRLAERHRRHDYEVCMSRLPRSLVVFAACGVLAASTLVAQTPAQKGVGATMTPEQILEHHSKTEKAGTPELGRADYEEKCAACHIFGGIGKEVGPDLTTIASRFKRRDILDAILFPSKVISDQYQAEMIQLKDGSIVTGVLVRESAAVVLLRTGENPDKPVSIPKGQIVERAVSPISLMPAGLLDDMTHEEIDNLLAFMLAPPPAK